MSKSGTPPAATPTFTVLGAGLAGPLMATYLGQAGHAVRLFEMRPDPRKADSGGGKSINLALSLRGIHALKEVGVFDAVQKIGTPMRGRMMHAVSGKLTFQPYGTEEDQFLLSVSRGELNQLLLDAAEACPGVIVRFNRKTEDVDLESNTVTLLDPGSGDTFQETAEILIGADGAFSRLRAAMQRRERFDYRQDWLSHGYKELTLPPTAEGDFALEPHALHIWPRGTFMMIALPNLDRTFTCTLFWPYQGTPSFATIRTEHEIRAFFEQTFPDFVPLMPNLVEEYQQNQVGSLVTVRCQPWYVEGRAALVGDACHAVVPFYGQGMNAAFEDCTVLMECLKQFAPDTEQAFRVYQERRKDNVDTLAEMALENFIEMRDHVGSKSFLIKKAGGRVLHRLFPRWYVPLYTMVTFTRMPYVDAKKRARRQDRIVAVGGGFLILVLAILVLVMVR